MIAIQLFKNEDGFWYHTKDNKNIISCKWQSSFSKITFFMCKNKRNFIDFEKLDCHLL
jgi:hypothetical protein